MVPLVRSPDWCEGLLRRPPSFSGLRHDLMPRTSIGRVLYYVRPVHRSLPPPRRFLATSNLYPMVHDPNLLQITPTRIGDSWSGRPRIASRRYFCEARTDDVSS